MLVICLGKLFADELSRIYRLEIFARVTGMYSPVAYKSFPIDNILRWSIHYLQRGYVHNLIPNHKNNLKVLIFFKENQYKSDIITNSRN